MYKLSNQRDQLFFDNLVRMYAYQAAATIMEPLKPEEIEKYWKLFSQSIKVDQPEEAKDRFYKCFPKAWAVALNDKGYSCRLPSKEGRKP